MLVLVLTLGCYKINYTNNKPTLEQSAIKVFLTTKGITQYCEQNVKVAIGKVQSTLQLPPIDFTVASFQIILSNSKFRELSIQDIQFQLGEGQAVLSINDIELNVIFELKIIQKTFPYLQDSGSLSIIIHQLKIQTEIIIQFNNQKCLNKYDIFTNRSKVSVDSFSFDFKCGLSIILNSISSLMNQYLLDQLNGALGEQLAEKITSELLKLLTSASELGQIDFAKDVATDQRYFEGIIVTKNFLTVASPGQRCIFNEDDDTCYGWLETNITPAPVYFSNHDVQYQIEKTAFNSGFDLYLKKERIVGEIQIMNINLTRFYNTGAQLMVTIKVNGIDEVLEFLEPVKFKPVEVKTDEYYGSFDIQLTNLLSKTTLTAPQLISLSDYFKRSYRIYQISYGNALGVSEEKAFTVYLDENWIMVMSDIV